MARHSLRSKKSVAHEEAPMSTASPTAQPHEVVWTLINHVIPSRSLQVVAELGVADHIGEEAVSVKQLASSCAADPDGLDRVLHLLATYGIFERHADRYRHTEASQLLRSDHPMSMRAFARMMGMPVIRASFNELEHSVRTGSPAIELAAGDGLWPYLVAHPDEAAIFGQAMTGKAAADTAAVLGAYDFGRFDAVPTSEVGAGTCSAPCSTPCRPRKGFSSTSPTSSRRSTSDATGSPHGPGISSSIPCQRPTPTSSWRSSTTGRMQRLRPS